jgi:hypothetical protein
LWQCQEVDGVGRASEVEKTQGAGREGFSYRGYKEVRWERLCNGGDERIGRLLLELLMIPFAILIANDIPKCKVLI